MHRMYRAIHLTVFAVGYALGVVLLLPWIVPYLAWTFSRVGYYVLRRWLWQAWAFLLRALIVWIDEVTLIVRWLNHKLGL